MVRDSVDALGGGTKAILWRTAEKLFDTLELDGYRANSVAYAMAWLAEHSKRVERAANLSGVVRSAQGRLRRGA